MLSYAYAYVHETIPQEPHHGQLIFQLLLSHPQLESLNVGTHLSSSDQHTKLSLCSARIST